MGSAPPYTNTVTWHTSQTDGSAHKSNYTRIRPRTAREMNRRGFGAEDGSHRPSHTSHNRRQGTETRLARIGASDKLRLCPCDLSHFY